MRNTIINSMINKKSINARDILSLKSKQSSRNANGCLPYQETPQQVSLYQTNSPDRVEKDHDFLSKIRVSRTNNRYRREGRQDKDKFEDEDRDKSGYVGNRSVNFNTRSEAGESYSISGHSFNHQIKLRKVENFSPFDSQQLKERFAVSGRICTTIHKNISSVSEIEKKLLKFKQLKQKKHCSLPSRKTEQQSRHCAKLTQFNTEFSKTRLFGPSDHSPSMKLIVSSSKKLSPYQLSVQRKNMHLIKMKLNGLGSQADKQQHEEYAKIAKQNQMNRAVQMRVKNQFAFIKQPQHRNTTVDAGISRVKDDNKSKRISISIETIEFKDGPTNHALVPANNESLISKARHRKRAQNKTLSSLKCNTHYQYMSLQ